MEEIVVGTITRTRGLKGEARLSSLASHHEVLFAPGSAITLVRGEKRLSTTVATFRVLPQGEFVSFTGLSDINLVLPWINSSLLIPRSSLSTLSEGEYYQSELIGLTARQGGVAVGTVSEVRHLPAGYYLVITKADGKSSLVPFRSELVTLDLAHHAIDIIEMEGLL